MADLCLQLTKKNKSQCFYDFVLTYHTLELHWEAEINVYRPGEWGTEFCRAVADTPEEAIRLLIKSNEIERKLNGSPSIKQRN